MEGLKKVLWAEGIFLGQQHFQAWDKYQFDAQLLRTRQHIPFYWGVSEIKWDENALLNGKLELTRCQAILEDGEVIDYQRSGSQPVTMDLSAWSEPTLTVALALPRNHIAQGITGYPQSMQTAAWRAEYQEVADTHDINRTREVALASPNLQLVRVEDITENMTGLPILQLIKAENGSYVIQSEHIFPVVSIGASPGLENLLKGLLEIIEYRHRVLVTQRNTLSGVSSFSPGELADFLLCKDLSVIRTQLLTLQEHSHLHPFELYRTLNELRTLLANHLDASRLDAHVNYDHNRPHQTFMELDADLRALLNAQTGRPEADVMLTRDEHGGYHSGKIDESTFDRCEFYLAVNHPSNHTDWIPQFPTLCKVGASSQIETMLGSALPGVPLVHCQRVPQKIRIKSGHEYYRLDTRSPQWQSIRTEQRLSVFCLGDFGDTPVELLVIEEH